MPGLRYKSKNAGFTLLELIIVIFLITLILGLSTLFFANMLPSNRFNATVRNISSAMKYTRSLAQIQGRPHAFTIDLDAKTYGTENRGTKEIPDGMNIHHRDRFDFFKFWFEIHHFKI